MPLDSSLNELLNKREIHRTISQMASNAHDSARITPVRLWFHKALNKKFRNLNKW